MKDESKEAEDVKEDEQDKVTSFLSVENGAAAAAPLKAKEVVTIHVGDGILAIPDGYEMVGMANSRRKAEKQQVKECISILHFLYHPFSLTLV